MGDDVGVGERGDRATDTDAPTSGGEIYEPNVETRTEDDFGPHGWVLVGMIVVAFVVAPGLILAYPHVLADRVPFVVAFLVVPLVPALLLGVIAVWAATRG